MWNPRLPHLSTSADLPPKSSSHFKTNAAINFPEGFPVPITGQSLLSWLSAYPACSVTCLHVSDAHRCVFSEHTRNKQMGEYELNHDFDSNMTLQQSSNILTLANLTVIKIKKGAYRAETTDFILSTSSHKRHLCGVDASHHFF